MTHTILASQDECSQQQEQQLLLSSSVNGNGGKRPPMVATAAGDPQNQPDPEALARLSIRIAHSLEMRRRARREAQA